MAEGNSEEIHLFYREIHHALFEYKGLKTRRSQSIRRQTWPVRF